MVEEVGALFIRTVAFLLILNLGISIVLRWNAKRARRIIANVADASARKVDDLWRSQVWGVHVAGSAASLVIVATEYGDLPRYYGLAMFPALWAGLNLGRTIAKWHKPHPRP